jgi:hypothetical protein
VVIAVGRVRVVLKIKKVSNRKARSTMEVRSMRGGAVRLPFCGVAVISAIRNLFME